jgi:Phage tail assembly chaperone
MKKFTMGEAPKTFKHEVIIDGHDGSQSVITVEYIYRSRSMYAKFIDDNDASRSAIEAVRLKALEASNAAKTAEDIAASAETLQDIILRQNELAVDILVKIAKGWDLAEKFDKPTLLEVYDQYPNVFNRINEDYQIAILAGRLKN